MLGISFYPNKESIDSIKDYINRAASYGFNYAFTSLLMTDDDINKTIESFREAVQYAKKKGFYVTLDVNPGIFDILGVSYKNLSFFKELGANAIRLDSNFDGLVESLISFDNADIDIVLNISNDTGNINNILTYEPNLRHLKGCHNFYPQTYTGLDLDYFLRCSKKYKAMGLSTGAFINSQIGQDGPHPYNDGLPTLEIHRNMNIKTQVKHLVATGLIDDIIIGNAFASDRELQEVANVMIDQLQFSIIPEKHLSNIEHFILFDKQHFNRGDINSYSIRSTFVKLEVQKNSINPNNTPDILFPGDITIGNSNFAQYEGELNIVKQKMLNRNHYKNLVGKVTEDECFLIDYIKPWKKFRFEEAH